MLGVSPDKPSAQKKFQQKYDFPFSLLSDEDKAVAKNLGVLKEKSMYGRKYMGIERTTFVIDSNRTVLDVISSELSMESHADKALQTLRARS